VCVLLDDMSDSCGTLCKAADQLKAAGARSVIGIVTHGVLSGGALRRVSESEGLELLVVTNTIPQEDRAKGCHKIRVIDVTPTFAEALRSGRAQLALPSVLRCKQEGLSLDHVFRLDQFHRLP
jgi:ribose-phosphate pyrophosphokinase